MIFFGRPLNKDRVVRLQADPAGEGSAFMEGLTFALKRYGAEAGTFQVYPFLNITR
jgi:hypothetical protein